jgi:hypothetical protein
MTHRNGPDRSRDVRLTQSVFTYVADCLKDRDHGAIRRLNLRPNHIERLRRLSAMELLRLGELALECLDVAIKPDALDEVLRRLEERQRQEALIAECLTRGAPRAMMTTFFGLPREKYVQLRAAYGIRAGAGRAPTPPAVVERDLYERWIRLGAHWSAPTLLTIAVETDVSLRVIWDQLRRFRPRRMEPATQHEAMRATA